MTHDADRTPDEITRGNEQITHGLTTALCDPGEMVTKYVAVAEIMDSDGCFRLAYSRDGVMPWDAAGMMRYAADSIRHTKDDDE